MTLPVIPLPDSLLQRPIAHRALHDAAHGRPENSREAIRAAINGNYGIEIDLQLSQDKQAMVFHDYDLGRLTSAKGPVQQHSAADLGEICLTHADDGIPTFSEVLDIVAGKVPLLVEIKDQDGALGPRVGALEQATAEALRTYKGDVAVMSFNPHSVAAFGEHAPTIARGLTTDAFLQSSWKLIPAATRRYLRDIPDFDRVGASFVSHGASDLKNPAIARLKAKAVPVLCWTVRSAKDEKAARKIADNVTFEGYAA